MGNQQYRCGRTCILLDLFRTVHEGLNAPDKANPTLPTIHLSTHSAKPEPKLLHKVLWNLLRPNLIINRSLSAPDISLGWIHPFGSLKELPKDERDEEDGNADIAIRGVSNFV